MICFSRLISAVRKLADLKVHNMSKNASEMVNLVRSFEQSVNSGQLMGQRKISTERVNWRPGRLGETGIAVGQWVQVVGVLDTTSKPLHPHGDANS